MALKGTITKKTGQYLIDHLFRVFETGFQSSVYNDPRVKRYLEDPRARDMLSEVYEARRRQIENAIRADITDAVTSILQLYSGSTPNIPTRIIDELIEYTKGGKAEYIKEAVKNRDWITAVGSLILEAVSFLDPTQITDIAPLYTIYEHERVIHDFRKRWKYEEGLGSMSPYVGRDNRQIVRLTDYRAPYGRKQEIFQANPAVVEEMAERYRQNPNVEKVEVKGQSIRVWRKGVDVPTVIFVDTGKSKEKKAA